MDKTLELIDQLDDARATVGMCLEDLLRHAVSLLTLPADHQDRTYHQAQIKGYERLLRYWNGRVDKLEAKLPALVQAEDVAAAAWLSNQQSA